MERHLFGSLLYELVAVIHLCRIKGNNKTGANNIIGATNIIESLHHVLNEMARSSTLPWISFLQLDNLFKENNNQFFMAYLECLEMWSVFTEIEVSLLYVEHTHGDVDQEFSCPSRRLWR